MQRDFFKEPFTADELRALLKSLNLTARDVLSTKSPSLRKMKIDPKTKSDEELLRLMVKEPRLIRRPLLVVGGKPVVGFNRHALFARSKKE